MSSTSRSVTPNGASYRPGRWTHPARQNSRVPVDCSVPIRANAAPPSCRMPSTFSRLSTLLTTVGLANRPLSTGNGGLLRGSPRYPSIELNSAVSSPQMYAPAPLRSSMSKRKPRPITSSPSSPRDRHCSIACSSRAQASGYSPRR